MPKLWRRWLLLVVLALTVLLTGFGDYRPSSLDLAVAGHRYSTAGWEVSHLADKWVHKLWDIMPWTSEPAREVRIAQVVEFFDIVQELNDLERRILFPQSGAGGTLSQNEVRQLTAEIDRIKERRRAIQSQVEETIESEISAVLAQEGLASRIGLIFPPVDAVFSGSPNVLVLSPRDRIDRMETVLLKPGLDDLVRERIEDAMFRQENLAALVESTGGVATYPSVVADSFGLRFAITTASHEWLHQWFFFQPLGQHFWDNADMTTLNETAATIAGREIGDRVYTAITGEMVVRNGVGPAADPETFSFNEEMRETRLRTEELLAQGRIGEAEAYMEERRLFMVENGFFIRKINQAFFAFHGSYATSAASISPIDGQLEQLRSRSDTLEDFLKKVAEFGSYGDFLGYLDATRTQAPAALR
ncbi:MAG: hypothetical protein BZY88_14115, partial [SAR202 cluster bacterium Io17-Chloro-G9]